MRKVVVYVHGLWLGGGESLLLRRRLSRALAAESRAFTYPSVGGSFTDNANALGTYLREMRADTLHLVAHSLGGLLVLKLFELMEKANASEASSGASAMRLPPGRVVLLGSPVRGSLSARRLARLPLGRTLLGITAAEVLLNPCERRWSGGRDLGVIAGDLGLGFGRLLGPMNTPNDGTVWVEETELPGAAAQLRLRTSHNGLVFSAMVARQIAAFLREGRFER